MRKWSWVNLKHYALGKVRQNRQCIYNNNTTELPLTTVAVETENCVLRVLKNKVYSRAGPEGTEGE